MEQEEKQDNREILRQIARYTKVGLIYLPKPKRFDENRAFFGRVIKSRKEERYKQFHLEGFEMYMQDYATVPERNLIGGTLIIPFEGYSQFVIAAQNNSHQEIKIVRVCPYENDFRQNMLNIYPNHRIHSENLEEELTELLKENRKKRSA